MGKRGRDGRERGERTTFVYTTAPTTRGAEEEEKEGRKRRGRREGQKRSLAEEAVRDGSRARENRGGLKNGVESVAFARTKSGKSYRIFLVRY